MNAYDEFAKRSDWKPGQKLQLWLNYRYLITLQKVINLSEVNNILEIGVGRGNFASAIIKNTHISYEGVEPSEALQRVVKSSFENLQIYDCSLPHVFQNINKKFDLVILIHTIEHAQNGYEARLWLEDAANCVAENGYLVIISPEILSFKEYFWDIDWSHCFPTSKQNLVQLGKDIGLIDYFAGHMNLGGISKVRKFFAKIIDLMFPTKLIDSIFMPIFNRKIGSGFKVAQIWDVCFIVFKMNTNE